MDLQSLTPFLSSATRAFARSVPTHSKLLRPRIFLGNPRFFCPQFFPDSKRHFPSVQTVQFQDADFPTRRQRDTNRKNSPWWIGRVRGEWRTSAIRARGYLAQYLGFN